MDFKKWVIIFDIYVYKWIYDVIDVGMKLGKIFWDFLDEK